MKKSVSPHLFAVSLLVSLLIGLSSCQLGLTPSKDTNGASLVVSLQDALSGQRTLLPAVSMDIGSYDIQGADQMGDTFQRTRITDSTIIVDSLQPGLWTVTAWAKNANGDQIGSGRGAATLVRGQVAPLTIDIKPISGPGSLSISLRWPAGALIAPRIVSSITPVGGAGSDLPFTLAEDRLTASATASLEHGYYSWSLQLYDGTVQVFGLIDAVRIAANFCTTGIVQLTVDTMNRAGTVQLTLTPQMDNPIRITLSGQQERLDAGASMTVTATTDQPVDWYQWYLNGVSISGATSATVTVGAALDPNYYQLSVIAGKGNVLSCATAPFNVITHVHL